MVDAMKDNYKLPETDCTFSSVDWNKFEIIEMNGNSPTVQSTFSCNGEEIENPLASDSFVFLQYFCIGLPDGDKEEEEEVC